MDKLVKINLAGIKDLAVSTVKNLSWLFVFIFIIILILDALQIKNSVKVVLNVNSEPELVVKEKGVRIDFANYDKVINRIMLGKSYEPNIEITANPFALK